MKNFLIKNWVVIVWAVSIIVDKQFGLAESIFSEDWQISLFQIFGSLILSWKWNPAINLNVSAKLDNTDPIRPGGPTKKF